MGNHANKGRARVADAACRSGSPHAPCSTVFDGVWVRKCGKDRMAEIKDGLLHWDKRFGFKGGVPFQGIEESGELIMEMKGDVLTAFLDGNELRWSDGDTWTRNLDDATLRWVEHGTLVGQICQSDGRDQQAQRAIGAALLKSLNLKVSEVGSKGRDESGNMLANQCFYLAIARCYTLPETPRDLLEDTALVFKRLVEASVLSSHPEWRDSKEEIIGEHSQAFADFIPAAMKDTEGMMAAMAAMVIDSASGQVELYRGPKYVDLDPIVQQKNMLLLWYTPGHYQCLVADDAKGSPPGFTYEKLSSRLRENGVLYFETVDFSD